MEAARFDTYYRYDELTRLLHDYAARYPALGRLQSIGRSFEGRDIWLVTITRFATGSDERKPALWVDANIHRTRWSTWPTCRPTRCFSSTPS